MRSAESLRDRRAGHAKVDLGESCGAMTPPETLIERCAPWPVDPEECIVLLPVATSWSSNASHLLLPLTNPWATMASMASPAAR